MPIIKIEVEGLKKITTGFIRFIEVVPKNMAIAGLEAINMVLDTPGLRTYPPETAANRPPTPYYIRGRGMQYKSGNTGGSQRYGSHWETEASTYRAQAKNTGVDYNVFLGGENQVWWASGYGWKKLFSTAKEMIDQIVEIYKDALDKTIKELGL